MLKFLYLKYMHLLKCMTIKTINMNHNLCILITQKLLIYYLLLIKCLCMFL